MHRSTAPSNTMCDALPKHGHERVLSLRERHMMLNAAAALATVTGMTLQQAEEVIGMVGSDYDLARLSEPALRRLPHIGSARAKKIRALTEWAVLLATSQSDERTQIRSPKDVANLLMMEMGLLEQEELRVIGLDMKFNVKSLETVYRGSLYHVNVRIAEILDRPLTLKCASMILVHNHPSGDPTPSPEDVRLTELVRKLGEQLDIDLRDHVVIGRNRFVSLRERGLGFE